MPFTQPNTPPHATVCLAVCCWRRKAVPDVDFFFPVQHKDLAVWRGGSWVALHRLGSLFIEMEEEGWKNKYTTVPPNTFYVSWMWCEQTLFVPKLASLRWIWWLYKKSAWWNLPLNTCVLLYMLLICNIPLISSVQLTSILNSLWLSPSSSYNYQHHFSIL